jgi:isopenicillin N synthase-like dioxygenase
MARAILSALEKPLQLPPGSLLKLHRLQDDSGDFTRILRYAGDPTNEPTRPEGFPPHKDAQTVAILFAWIGGLQIPDPKIPVEGFAVKEEDWRWVKPEPGYAVVNLGDAMEIYTNKLLRSCIHRVFKSPGLQRPHDRYSVLFATRPKNDSLMKVLESPVIPPGDPTEESITSLEWGHRIIAAVQSRARARGARDLDNI